MTTITPNSRSPLQHATDDSISVSLGPLEGMLNQSSGNMFDAEHFEEVGKELRRLHARLRIHHAADYVAATGEPSDIIPPELSEEMNRLRAEHPVMLRQLDCLIRSVDSMADRSLEDKEVFVLRGRELIAMLRRHEAEEDRLFYLSVWRDIGGES